uniref:Uncharacterized protein n=1 Tax=Arundo donax TaxID=35708 RepID=A0A0A9EPP2_ARUDO
MFCQQKNPVRSFTAASFTPVQKRSYVIITIKKTLNLNCLGLANFHLTNAVHVPPFHLYITTF